MKTEIHGVQYYFVSTEEFKKVRSAINFSGTGKKLFFRVYRSPK